MSRSENCPTCGTKLGPSHARAAMQNCTACNQMNPAGFIYCGFCATPMESTEMRAQIAELAAPPGGWPNLTSELVEVRFYLQQGLFDDAYELLSILQKRHPGHPQLTELARRPKAARRVDTGVMALVDSVLAESANLVAKVPRRAAPRFTAPAQGGSDRTDVHSVVPVEDEPTTARPQPQRPKTGGQSTTRRATGGQPTTSTRTASGSHRAAADAPSPRRTSTGSNRTAAAEPAPAQRREPTRIYRAVEPPAARASAPAPAPARPSPAAAPRSASAGTRGEPSAPRAVVQAPAIVSPPTGRASSTPRAPSAPASTSRGATTPRAAEPASPVSSAAEPAVTGRTVVQRPPQSGHTVIVDALQAPAPFAAVEEPQPSRRGGSRRRRDAEPAAPAAQAAPATPAEAPAAAAKTEQPRRRTTFGEHVLNRLR